jgi:threonine/homoserine/homoserine lactone efflux protein
MSPKNEIVKSKSSSKNTVVFGALIGASAGVAAAMLLHRRALKHGRESMVTVSEGIQLGLLVFGLLRAISALGNDD